MKKIVLFFIILLGTLSSLQAQNAPLNKQQTLEYIEKLYKETYQFNENKVLSVTIDGKILVIKFSSDGISRRDLSKADSLFLGKPNSSGHFDIRFVSEYYAQILCCIQLEADANRLKKALEHLIEILKTEKSTDPFGE